jgi:hypothetical protein
MFDFTTDRIPSLNEHNLQFPRRSPLGMSKLPVKMGGANKGHYLTT